jgi:hypothetical protein
LLASECPADAAGGTPGSSTGPGDVPVSTKRRGGGDFDAERELDAAALPVEVKEQRLSGLLQSLLCGACLGALQHYPVHAEL